MTKINRLNVVLVEQEKNCDSWLTDWVSQRVLSASGAIQLNSA